MKTKTYLFTEDELITLHNSLTEYHQMIKNLKPLSPIAVKNQKNAKTLKDQFKIDLHKYIIGKDNL